MDAFMNVSALLNSFVLTELASYLLGDKKEH